MRPAFEMNRRYNLVYLCTYLDQDLSEKFSLSYSQAGLSKKRQFIDVVAQHHNIRPIFVSCFSRVLGRVFMHQKHRISEEVVLEVPVFSTVLFFNYIINPIATFHSMLAMNKIQQIDFLILYNLTYETVVPAALMKMFVGVKVVVQMEDGVNPSFGKIKNFIGRLAERLGAGLASGVIVNSRNFLPKFPKIPHFVFRGVASEQARILRKNSESDAAFNILFASTIDNIRGADLLARFFCHVQKIEEFKSVQFIVCGSGENKCVDKLKRSISEFSKKGGNAEYLGFVSSEVYSSICNSTHLFLSLQDPSCPFSSYCFPSKVFEYYGYNRPIISTKVSDLAADEFFGNLNFVDYEVNALESEILTVKSKIKAYMHANSDNSARLASRYSLESNSLSFSKFLSAICVR